MPLLSLKNLSKSFAKTAAVSDVSLDVERGEFFGLLGPSGCGKTTTLRMIAGLEKPDSGTIEFDGNDITNQPAERRGFGMVFQNYALFPHLNVFENVAFGLRARHRSKPEVLERVKSALDLVQLPGYEKRRVDELSGGQQQRVAIARALVQKPALLLADEPTGDLDERNAIAIFELMQRLHREHGLTSILATHNTVLAERADRVLQLEHGLLLPVGDRPKP